jgi:hypothetical protein
MPLDAIRSQPDSVPADPKKRSFEDAITYAFARVPGVWTARISRTPFSWTVIVERTDGCRRTLVFDPHHQTPDGVAAELTEALRDLE